jgi:hypothetical protein
MCVCVCGLIRARFVCVFAVFVCALSAISGQLRARARRVRQHTHTHTHTHQTQQTHIHAYLSLAVCLCVCLCVCVCTRTHTHSHTHTHTIQIALIAGGASLAFIVLSASLVAMYLRNRKIYREYSVLKEQNEAELELDRIGASVWN